MWTLRNSVLCPHRLSTPFISLTINNYDFPKRIFKPDFSECQWLFSLQGMAWLFLYNADKRVSSKGQARWKSVQTVFQFMRNMWWISANSRVITMTCHQQVSVLGWTISRKGLLEAEMTKQKPSTRRMTPPCRAVQLWWLCSSLCPRDFSSPSRIMCWVFHYLWHTLLKYGNMLTW